MAEVSQIITTNKKFYIENSPDDVIDRIQAKEIDGQTGKESEWFYFFRLKQNRVFDNVNFTTTGRPCFVKGDKTIIKKTAIKSILGIDEDALVFESMDELLRFDKDARERMIR